MRELERVPEIREFGELKKILRLEHDTEITRNKRKRKTATKENNPAIKNLILMRNAACV